MTRIFSRIDMARVVVMNQSGAKFLPMITKRVRRVAKSKTLVTQYNTAFNRYVSNFVEL